MSVSATEAVTANAELPQENGHAVVKPTAGNGKMKAGSWDPVSQRHTV